MSAISATASRLPKRQKHLRALRAGGRDRRGGGGARHIPTAGGCLRSNAQARSGSRRFARISASAAAARSSIGRPTPTAPGNTISSSRRWRRRSIECEVAPLIDAHGVGRRRITLHARMGTHDVLKVGFAAANSHDIIPVDRCPILDPGLNGALDAAWALAEPLISIGKPLDIQVTATNNGLDIDVRGSGPLPTGDDRDAVAHRRTASAGAADAAWRTGADAHAAGRHDRHRAGHLAARLVPAGDRRRRRGAGGTGRGTLQARQTYRRSVLRGRAVRAAAGSEARVSAFDSDAGAVAALQKAATSTPG